jgi:hypothetical protein
MQITPVWVQALTRFFHVGTLFLPSSLCQLEPRWPPPKAAIRPISPGGVKLRGYATNSIAFEIIAELEEGFILWVGFSVAKWVGTTALRAQS